MNNAFYKGSLPCKPYIKKFAEKLFGNPIQVSPGTTIGLMFYLSLSKNAYENRWFNDEKGKSYLVTHNQQLEYCITKWQFTNLGADIPRMSILQINRFLENLFDQSLYLHVKARLKDDREMKGWKDALLSFAEEYNLVLDPDIGEKEDITYEGLKKKEYRYRSRNFVKM